MEVNRILFMVFQASNGDIIPVTLVYPHCQQFSKQKVFPIKTVYWENCGFYGVMGTQILDTILYFRDLFCFNWIKIVKRRQNKRKRKSHPGSVVVGPVGGF